MTNSADVVMYLCSEGYATTLKAVKFYKMRLRTVSKSPELENAAMFVQILQLEASKTIGPVESLLDLFPLFLQNPAQYAEKIVENLSLIKKALDSYSFGMQKVIDGQSEYYSKLLNTIPTNQDIQDVKNALMIVSNLTK